MGDMDATAPVPERGRVDGLARTGSHHKVGNRGTRQSRHRLPNASAIVTREQAVPGAGKQSPTAQESHARDLGSINAERLHTKQAKRGGFRVPKDQAAVGHDHCDTAVLVLENARALWGRVGRDQLARKCDLRKNHQ